MSLHFTGHRAFGHPADRIWFDAIDDDGHYVRFAVTQRALERTFRLDEDGPAKALMDAFDRCHARIEAAAARKFEETEPTSGDVILEADDL